MFEGCFLCGNFFHLNSVSAISALGWLLSHPSWLAGWAFSGRTWRNKKPWWSFSNVPKTWQFAQPPIFCGHLNGVISPNYWTKSWTLTSSVPFNRLKCNHFDLCQNRGEDLGFDPPSPRLLREFDEFAAVRWPQCWGSPPEKPFSKEVSHSMSTRWTRPVTSF